MLKTTKIFTAALLMVTACSPVPDQISALPVSSDVYAGANCKELEIHERSLESLQHELMRTQQRAATNDVVSVALFGIPTARAKGRDRTREIADVKGRLEAVRQRKAGLGC